MRALSHAMKMLDPLAKNRHPGAPDIGLAKRFPALLQLFPDFRV